MHYKKILLLALTHLILFSFISAFVVSPDDVSKFVSVDNHFLKEGESTEFNPNTTISFEGKEYWVVSILKGTDLVGYVSVLDVENPIILEDKPLNRKLFENAFILGKFFEKKDALSKQNQWFFTSIYSNRFSDLAQAFDDSKNKVNLIKSDKDITNSEIKSKIQDISTKLDSMILLSNQISRDISTARVFETNYILDPSIEKFNEFKSFFFQLDESNSNSVLFKVDSLKKKVAEYRRDIASLTILIGQSDLDDSKKSFISDSIKLPQKAGDVSTYADILFTNKASLDSITNLSLNQIDIFLKNFDSRLKLNNAFALFFDSNEKIKKSSKDSSIASLESACKNILETNRKPLWKKKSLVEKLEKNCPKIQASFEKENFDEVIVLATESIDDVKLIYEGGIELPVDPIDNKSFNDLIFKLIIALILLLVVLVLFKNREKIAGFFNKGSSGDDFGKTPFD